MKQLQYIPMLSFLVCALAMSAPVKTDLEALSVASAAIRKFGLTALADQCRSISVAEQPSRFDLVVRERHEGNCGGDPQIAPRLFGMRIRKRDGRLTSDIYDSVTYEKVNHKLVRQR